MSLHYTAAHSSRIRKKDPLRRPSSSSSPFSSHPRKKPNSSSTAKKRPSVTEDDYPDIQTERLDDTGLIPSLSRNLDLSGVLEIMQHVQENMFTPVPDRAPGMSSKRIAEVLNFRISLPPIISISHIHALSNSPTSTEREISSLAGRGVLRRVYIPNRGTGSSATGEGVALVSEWERMLSEHNNVADTAKAKYVQLMKAHPTTLSISASTFTNTEAIALTQAGFLTTSSAAPTTADRFLAGAALNSPTAALNPKHVAKAASGSLAAIGGSNAFLSSGGGSGSSAADNKMATGMVNFSLPNTGPYLHLLSSARAHMVSLLSKASPRYKEMPLDSLRERWDGGVSTRTLGEEARKERGDKRGFITPGKTKKWRQFHGLEFRWVLEECVGAGMVELFGTGAVGIGVRAT
ncbi:hypothetical protein NA57DRAFT_76346 [Rhizodiscina lignyota]|uniref:Serine-threonine protein kinase 19 n=1 Tax=Rhizodiscina lignyota TaxID=1504668 RepID=A0A9P4IGZ9_9PEZI|nr:hypothetical protein NA57DRAFT_76346 [Rhizodiscina lignyota]